MSDRAQATFAPSGINSLGIQTKIQPVEGCLCPADAANTHKVDEGCIVPAVGRHFLGPETRDILLEYHALPVDQFLNPLRSRSSRDVQLERKVDAHVAWMAHGIVDPTLDRLPAGLGEPVHPTLRMIAGILHLAGNEPVALESGKQGVEMTRTEMDDVAQGRVWGEAARKIVAVCRLFKE